MQPQTWSGLNGLSSVLSKITRENISSYVAGGNPKRGPVPISILTWHHPDHCNRVLLLQSTSSLPHSIICFTLSLEQQWLRLLLPLRSRRRSRNHGLRSVHRNARTFQYSNSPSRIRLIHGAGDSSYAPFQRPTLRSVPDPMISFHPSSLRSALV